MEKNVIQINGGITINIDVNVKIVMYVKNCHDCVWNPATCNYGNGKYLANIIDDSAIKRKPPVKPKISIFYLHFYELHQHY